MSSQSLDVGCGNFPCGDVNLDLFLKDSLHRTPGTPLKGLVSNLVNADAHYLPFRSNSFEIVKCFSLLEHVGIDVVKVCRELIRVAKGKVLIKVPMVAGNSNKSVAHARVFTSETLNILFRRFKRKVSYRHFLLRATIMPFSFLYRVLKCRYKFGLLNPLYFMPFLFPTELYCVVWKR